MSKIDIKDDYSERVKYDYSEYPIYIRRDLLSNFSNYAAESHWHEDIELIVALSGEMQYNVNGEIVTLNEGEGILVNAKQLHHGFSEARHECDFICILFHPILMCLTRVTDHDYASRILESGAPYFHLSPKIAWQSRIIEHIKDIWDKKDETVAPLYAQGKLCLLWSELLTQTERMKAPKGSDGKLTTLKNMIGFIHEHYKEKITLEEIAKSGYVSKRSCGMIFLEYQNKTPIEFLTDYRLRKSIELMKHSELTILDIALSVGFSSASYYAETFRKSFGVSPVEYRKANEVR
ncbi:MAG: AraC family transcriptional regulator [Clostridia bacterium]|nr:AraC family transcriptional regulator [Clostridia bacterium]